MVFPRFPQGAGLRQPQLSTGGLGPWAPWLAGLLAALALLPAAAKPADKTAKPHHAAPAAHPTAKPSAAAASTNAEASSPANPSANATASTATTASTDSRSAAAPDFYEPLRQAREAFAKHDRKRVAELRQNLLAADPRSPLLAWVDYWDMNLRLNEATATEVQAFFARWPGRYVEDRLRNDWLLELGRRRDWAGFARELPQFRMNDDKQVACYALWADQANGKPVAAEAARQAWMAQKEPDDGCQRMAQALFGAGVLGEADVWRKLRHAVEHNRRALAQQTAALLGEASAKAIAEVLADPQRHMKHRATAMGHQRTELTALALARIAAADPAEAADALERRWGIPLGTEHGAWAWAQVAKQGALSLNPDSLLWVRKAWAALPRTPAGAAPFTPDWSDETLGWMARATLRLAPEPERWSLVQRAIDAMSPTERADPAWLYWRARSQLGLAAAGEAGNPARLAGRMALGALSQQLNFYGQLAAEDLGAVQPLPARPAPLSAGEREAGRAIPGLRHALALLAAGLRPEAVREWNFHLIGLSERQLLAAAQFACEQQVWDRCINTSDRTRQEVDMSQRFPTPLREDVLARSQEIGLDPAFVYGLIRQESRFIMDAHSGVGAAGLMQVMPATARWTAKKIGLTGFKPEHITERDTNLRIGSAYLKLVLDDAGGQPLAAAAYNAGPGRPRKWREGPVLEPAIWIENIPIHETRDYVKKVSSNAAYYAGLFTGKPSSLKARLGNSIGPRDPVAASPADADLP